MLLRSVLKLSSRRGVARIPRPIASAQIQTYLRRELSTQAHKEAVPQPNASGKPPKSGSSLSKVVVGGAVVSAAIFAAYQTGYLDQIIGHKDQKDSVKEVKGKVESQDLEDIKMFEDHSVIPGSKEAVEASSSAVDEKFESVVTPLDHPHAKALSEEDGAQSLVQDKSDNIPKEDVITSEEKDLVDHPQGSLLFDQQSSDSTISSEGSQEVDNKSAGPKTDEVSNNEVKPSSAFTEANESNDEVKSSSAFTEANESNNEVKASPALTEVNVADDKSGEKVGPSPVHFTIVESEEHAKGIDIEEPSSLLEEYNLDDSADGFSGTLHKHSGKDDNYIIKEEEALTSALEELGDGYISKDGKLVLDFLQAIHAAESRQAELDARMYAEEKRALKEKYERELKDAAVRELMLAEEAAMLDKELKRERTKAAAALKSLQDQLEEKYKMELEQKKRAAEQKLKKIEELAKAELAARIASEKAAHIEKIAEANLHINALCMAFYARSEEARLTHSAHKLALGALALEDALSKGLPIQTEIGALRNYLEGIDKDSVLDLVLSSLPDETRNNGTDTLLQLNQKFDVLKGTLRHFSLIPPEGGGILAHSVAHVASWLKVKEADESGDGIESLINKVESHLAEGKIAEAANVLEEGVRGTQASGIVVDWVSRARNRAITEQALSLLQSYATSISIV